MDLALEKLRPSQPQKALHFDPDTLEGKFTIEVTTQFRPYDGCPYIDDVAWINMYRAMAKRIVSAIEATLAPPRSLIGLVDNPTLLYPSPLELDAVRIRINLSGLLGQDVVVIEDQCNTRPMISAQDYPVPNEITTPPDMAARDEPTHQGIGWAFNGY